jgi:tRNA (cmo5U34)-methyltransferase
MTSSRDQSLHTPVPEHLKGQGAADYAERARWFIPGYDASHALAAVLLRDRMGDEGRILVVGAGGGVELSLLARECAGWKFVGVDPSPDMLAVAKRQVEEARAASRVMLVEGYIDDVQDRGFDAATAFLALHFVPDDGRRLRTLEAIHARLNPGAPFLMIDGCLDKSSPQFGDDMRIYAAFARRAGAPADLVEAAVKAQDSVFPLPPVREEALLAQAGFRGARVFYAGMWVMGWIASA